MSPFGHMSHTRYRTLAGLCLALGALGPVAGAQNEPRPASTLPTQPSTQPQSGEYWLRVTAETLNLRSRPDTNSVPVVRVERDAILRAVGSQFGWHKVVPPEGVFSYVSAAHVVRQSETEGVVSVTSGALRVRVGSLIQDVDPAAADVQTVLERGATVRILGAAGDWLKIAPPAGVYAYAADAYVTRVDAPTAVRLLAEQGVTSRPVRIAATSAPARPVRATSVPTTTAPDLSGPWGQRLVLVEATIEAEAARPTLERSWDALIARLRPITEQHEEPTVARLAVAWIRDLEGRTAAQQALRAAQELEQRGARERALQERELARLEQVRQRAATRPAYAARGELLPSLAVGERQGRRLYKLQDPLTRQVEVYVELDPESQVDLESLIGKYVGVRGARRADESLGADVVRVEEVVVLESERPASQPTRRQP